MVHVASWQAAYRDFMPSEFLANLSVKERAAMWSQCISSGQPSILVVGSESEIVGFVAYGKARDASEPEHTGEVWAIYVEPRHWKRAAGKALLAAAVEDLYTSGFKRVVLWALEGNERADRFYVRTGFVKDIAARREFNIAGVQLQENRYELPPLQDAT
jgi:GNAT superfamily N-acetyltransferase